MRPLVCRDVESLRIKRIAVATWLGFPLRFSQLVGALLNKPAAAARSEEHGLAKSYINNYQHIKLNYLISNSFF